MVAAESVSAQKILADGGQTGRAWAVDSTRPDA